MIEAVQSACCTSKGFKGKPRWHRGARPQGASLGPVLRLLLFLPILDLRAKKMEARSTTAVVVGENGDRKELRKGLNSFAGDVRCGGIC
jgi:hypothetical protein